MTVLGLVGQVLWLFVMGVNGAEFNDTFTFTVTPTDGMMDVDGATEGWGPGFLVLNEKTGFRGPSRQSNGWAGCFFVGSGYVVRGSAQWNDPNHTVDYSDPVEPHSPVTAYLQYPVVGDSGRLPRTKGPSATDPSYSLCPRSISPLTRVHGGTSMRAPSRYTTCQSMFRFEPRRKCFRKTASVLD